MFATLLALALPAAAATHEISAEVGWINSSDPAWDFFSEAALHGSYGLRLGYAVHPNVAIIGGWQHAVNGVGTSGPGIGAASYSDGGDDYYYDNEDAFWAALYTDQVTVGAKADFQVLTWLHPYATVQAVGMRGLLRMDDDSQDDENLTQIELAGLTGGVLGAVGLDLPVPLRVGSTVAIAPYAEVGYGWLAPMQFEQLGSVQFAGFTGRAGVGVRF
jgi:hypothetical protein